MSVDMNMEILIVDDYRTMLRIIRNLLKQIGFDNIDEATDGSMALKKMREKSYGLVISDWNMEDIDGLTLLKVIRKHPRTQGMPFIMATGRSDKEQVKEAITCGVNNYIIKPFDASTMKKRIEAVIGALS